MTKQFYGVDGRDYARPQTEREAGRQFTRANVLELENAALRDALKAWTRTHGATDWACGCALCTKSRAALSSSPAA